MRVLVDARVIQDHFPGIGRYVFNLLRAMGPMVRGEVLALVDPGAVNTRYDLDALARVPRLRLIPTSIPVFGLSSQRALPSLIRELRPDVVHFPYYVRPLRVDAPTVLTLYDVIPRRFPEYFPRLTRWKIEVMKRAAIGRSRGLSLIHI